jgi:hypothetical protein
MQKDRLGANSRNTTTQGRFWQSVDRQPVKPKQKPYTARVVPPLLVGDLKKFETKALRGNDDNSFVMTQDSIHSDVQFDQLG